MNGRVLVIVPAGGSGTRFGGDVPKQFRTLGGTPLLQRVVERFIVAETVSRVVVPIPQMLLAAIKDQGDGRVQFVAGGATRQQSVISALDAAGDDYDLVAIHDAVRPFFSMDTFEAAVVAAREHGASCPMVPVADTIHVVESDFIAGTPDRRTLFAAQTPQCFKLDVLRDVLVRAQREGDDATDEAGLAAKYGYPVRVVHGDSMNFKITRPEDLVMAERIVAEWGEE